MILTPAFLQQSELDARADAIVLERVIARDHTAIGVLYDRHCGVLYGLILRILTDRVDAEDVLQEVFLRVWLRAETYCAARGTPAGWLIGIARHRAIDRLRTNRVRARAEEAAPLPAAPAAADAHATASQVRAILVRAIDALPREQHELIRLAYFNGMTQSELATRFGLPLGTVKTRIRSGMHTLRAQLSLPTSGIGLEPPAMERVAPLRSRAQA